MKRRRLTEDLGNAQSVREHDTNLRGVDCIAEASGEEADPEYEDVPQEVETDR
jgi:hypothetical protein